MKFIPAAPKNEPLLPLPKVSWLNRVRACCHSRFNGSDDHVPNSRSKVGYSRSGQLTSHSEDADDYIRGGGGSSSGGGAGVNDGGVVFVHDGPTICRRVQKSFGGHHVCKTSLERLTAFRVHSTSSVLRSSPLHLSATSEHLAPRRAGEAHRSPSLLRGRPRSPIMNSSSKSP